MAIGYLHYLQKSLANHFPIFRISLSGSLRWGRIDSKSSRTFSSVTPHASGLSQTSLITPQADSDVFQKRFMALDWRLKIRRSCSSLVTKWLCSVLSDHLVVTTKTPGGVVIWVGFIISRLFAALGWVISNRKRIPTSLVFGLNIMDVLSRTILKALGKTCSLLSQPLNHESYLFVVSFSSCVVESRGINKSNGSTWIVRIVEYISLRVACARFESIPDFWFGRGSHMFACNGYKLEEFICAWVFTYR